MPNKVTPTIEEANQLFKDKPHYKLKDWAKEWGVSIERVRQIKEQAGIVPMSEIDTRIVNTIVQRIKNGESTLTNRALYSGLPIGYDRFRSWMIKDPSIKEECDLAREEYLSSDKTEKKCYKCDITDIVKIVSQKLLMRMKILKEKLVLCVRNHSLLKALIKIEL